MSCCRCTRSPFEGIVKATDQKEYFEKCLSYLEEEIKEVKKALGELSKKS